MPGALQYQEIRMKADNQQNRQRLKCQGYRRELKRMWGSGSQGKKVTKEQQSSTLLKAAERSGTKKLRTNHWIQQEGGFVVTFVNKSSFIGLVGDESLKEVGEEELKVMKQLVQLKSFAKKHDCSWRGKGFGFVFVIRKGRFRASKGNDPVERKIR